MSRTAVVLAGSRPGGDPFARQFGTEWKALIPLAGEPMLVRPLRALAQSSCIGDILVLSQDPDHLAANMPSVPGIAFRRSRGSIAQTMLDLVRDPSVHWPLLVTTADHALLDAAMIDEFCRFSSGCDIAIGLVERRTLLDHFPRTRRTWLKFKGGAYTGANLFALASPAVAPAIEKWRKIEEERKKGWRIIAALGPVLLAGVALRLVTIEGALAHLGRKLELSIRAVRLSNPLAGIDVDKPDDYALVETILAGSQ